MVAVLFAFEGWTAVGAISGEMKNTKRDLPRAIIGGVSIITAVYFVMNLAYLQVLPAEEMAKLPAPASAVAVALFGVLPDLSLNLLWSPLSLKSSQWL